MLLNCVPSGCGILHPTSNAGVLGVPYPQQHWARSAAPVLVIMVGIRKVLSDGLACD